MKVKADLAVAKKSKRNGFWLMKSEPHLFSIDDLAAMPNQTSYWHGVRNYQARNLLRDDFRIGDKVLFYHSSCAVPAVVGTAVVVRSGYPDHTAWDKNADYFDPKSSEDNPRWYMVDVQLTKKLTRPVTLAEMRTSTELEDMALLRKGNRLSIQPVTAKEFSHVLKMALSRVT